jgi:hypothetical protein
VAEICRKYDLHEEHGERQEGNRSSPTFYEISMPSAGVTGRTAQEAGMHYTSMIEECKRQRDIKMIIEKGETRPKEQMT